MDKEQILAYFSNLSDSNQQSLLTDLNRIKIASDYFFIIEIKRRCSR